MNRFRCAIGLQFVLGALCCPIAAYAQKPAADKPQVSPVTGLVPDHAGLSVADVRREAEWYERVLGFKVLNKYNEHVLATQAAVNPEFINWHLAIPGYRIDLVQYRGSKRPPPVDPVYLQQGWVHVVFHVDDVALALKQLQALDVKVDVTYLCGEAHQSTPCEGGKPIQIYLYDPEGNQLEIRRNVQL
jgi:catechol 2,3-dioxygenase-like lactoylglutathione lyase family enzyme